MSRLAKNPLFDAEQARIENASDDPNFDVEKERKELGIEIDENAPQRGRPRKDGLVRSRGMQQGLPPELTRSTIIVRTELMDKMKDYAYTERITIKEAVDMAFSEFLKDKTDLLPHRR